MDLFFRFSDVLYREELIQSCVFTVIQQDVTLCCISQWCSNVRFHSVNVIHRECLVCCSKSMMVSQPIHL